jgi:hypothetical protein
MRRGNRLKLRVERRILLRAKKNSGGKQTSRQDSRE